MLGPRDAVTVGLCAIHPLLKEQFLERSRGEGLIEDGMDLRQVCGSESLRDCGVCRASDHFLKTKIIRLRSVAAQERYWL